jgi:hypothetical protein
MKNRRNNSTGASIALIFASAILLVVASVQSVHAAGSESSAAPKPTEARVTHEPNLTAPAGLKPVEQEAWLAMARRQEASDGNELASVYPKRYDQPFVVEGEGVSGSWVTTGSLATARDLHTATLLPSGQVLVAGGVGNSGSLSEELYDPASGSWSSTGSLATARYYHTATLLPSGLVLVAGGFGNSGSLSSAELYDPASGSWSSTDTLVTARYRHTATLLPSGQVLMAGGIRKGGSLSKAELYDPASGSWSSTGSLATGRYDHAATLLPSGEVLVAGGYKLGLLSSAELYDPAKVSQITPAETTCSQFSSDTAETLGSVRYNTKEGLIGRVHPRNFLYWVPVTAPAGDNVFRITQTITTGNFDTFFAGGGNGTSVFDSDCLSLEGTARQSGDTTTVRFNAPAAGTYFIAINFDARSLTHEPVPSPTTVHYEFTTTGVSHSTSGLDVVED